VPATVVAIQLRGLMVDTGDDLPTVARGIGLDPDWAQRVLDGDVIEVDVAHVQQLCEGLQCTPYDLFGAEAARSIAHVYGPELWPSAIEPLDPMCWRPGDSEAIGLYDPNPAIRIDGPILPLAELAKPDLDLGPSLDL
jgi:DNA-binding Xre family transcriptional regulator